VTEPVEDSADVIETRESFAAALAGWGLTAAQIEDTLAETDFGLGMVDLRPADGPSDGVAIVVDDRRDTGLRELFDWRAGQADESGWAFAPTPQVRIVLGPDEQALVRLEVSVREPVALRRRYLFAVGAVAPRLSALQIAGTALWLTPSTLIERLAARGGPTDAYDAAALSLRVGRIARPFPTIDEALAHVGMPRETVRPMNRAERRAAARRKR
jgi:hypothetical protein